MATVKRNFRTLTGRKGYRPWNQWEVGDELTVKLESTGKDKYKKTSYQCTVESVSFSDEEAQKKFAVGNIICLNSVGSLDGQFEAGHVCVGDVINFVYDGMGEMGSGDHQGEQAHSIIISVASEEEEEDVVNEDGEDDLSGL